MNHSHNTCGSITDTGSTTKINCNIDYSKILLIMMLIIISWGKHLKTDPYRETSLYATCVKPFLLCVHPNKIIYVCYCSTWKLQILTSNLTLIRLNVQIDATKKLSDCLKNSNLAGNDSAIFRFFRFFNLRLQQ